MKYLKINSYVLKVALGILRGESFRKVIAALYIALIGNQTSEVYFDNFNESEKFLLQELIKGSEVVDCEEQ